MSKIEIVKRGITKLDVDAIVNAANSGLQAGGGVCGAIFAEAGYEKLQNACNQIGHCPTGSAVITPGFDLKASYIIHAVGPIWNGGNHGEPEQLYGAYYKSMELAAENRCQSIGFPLISAGIFGYPKDKAWEVAIRACKDYFQKNPDHNVTVVFAILDEKIIAIGQTVLNKYSIQDNKTESHPCEEDQNKPLGIQAGTIIGFHLPEEPNGCFSNWYPSPFTYAGVEYNCVEQYMMAQKVSLGRRYDLRSEIMQTEDPEKMKSLGGKSSYPEFVDIQKVWDKNCRHIVKRGVKAKFEQNPKLLAKLFETGNALLCECAGQDRVWGIGINLHNPDWRDVEKWKGSNYLGIILMEVREELRNEASSKGSVQYIDFRDAAPIAEWKMSVKYLKRIPQYYSAVHAYADQLPYGHVRSYFYECPFDAVEEAMATNMGGGLPISGFFEMKQEIYEIAHRLHSRPYVSEIFRENPRSWASRGAPYFWKDLQKAFAFDEITMSKEELDKKIFDIFKQKTGEELSENKTVFVEDYAHGGMSSGVVCGEWVMNTCIPTLEKRLEQLKEFYNS